MLRAPLMVLMIGPKGIPYGASKTTISATIRYILENLYGIDTTEDEDRDAYLTANNDPSLAKFKQELPQVYQEHSLRSHKRLLSEGLRKSISRLIFVNGDFNKALSQEEFQTTLQQIVTGTFPDQAGQSNIIAIACESSREIRRKRIIDRNNLRDRDKKYLQTQDDFDQEDADGIALHGDPLDHLKKCGIDVHSVNTDTEYPRISVTLSGKSYLILDYSQAEVKAFIDPIIAALNLHEIMQQLGHAIKPRTSSDPDIKMETTSSPLSAAGRTRFGSGDFRKNRPRTFSDATKELDDLVLGQSLHAGTPAERTMLPSDAFKRRRNSEGDILGALRRLIPADSSFIGSVQVSTTLLSALESKTLDITAGKLPESHKSSEDLSPPVPKVESPHLEEQQAFMGTVPFPEVSTDPRLPTTQQDQIVEILKRASTNFSPPLAQIEPGTTEVKVHSRKRRHRSVASDTDAKAASRYLLQQTEMSREEQIKRARREGSEASRMNKGGHAQLTAYQMQQAALGQQPSQLHRVVSESSIHSCRSAASSPRDTRGDVASPPVTFGPDRLI